MNKRFDLIQGIFSILITKVTAAHHMSTNIMLLHDKIQNNGVSHGFIFVQLMQRCHCYSPGLIFDCFYIYPEINQIYYQLSLKIEFKIAFDYLLQMENQDDVNESQWKLGVNEPFQGDREKFAQIPKDQRPERVRKMVETQQLNTPPPFNYLVPFPEDSTFRYKEYDLQYYSIENTPQPKAVLVIIHGVNGNGVIFGYFAKKIAQKNKELNVYAFDQVNFGKSQGDARGLIRSLEDSVSQAETFLNLLLSKFEVKPKIFLCGHSFGGTVSFKMALRQPEKYAGVIFLTPGLRDILENYYYTKRVMKFIGWMIPSLRMPFNTPAGLGTTYNMRQYFSNDPNTYTGGMMPGTIRSVMNGVSEISQSYGKFTSPFLCIAAGVEKLVDPFAVLDFQEESPSKDKKVIFCEHMWHVVMCEKEIVGVSWHCAEWLKQRI